MSRGTLTCSTIPVWGALVAVVVFVGTEEVMEELGVVVAGDGFDEFTDVVAVVVVAVVLDEVLLLFWFLVFFSGVLLPEASDIIGSSPR